MQTGNIANLQPLQRKATTTDKIDQIKINRDARRIRMEEARKLRSEREAHNELQAYRSSVYVSFDRPAPKHRSRDDLIWLESTYRRVIPVPNVRLTVWVTVRKRGPWLLGSRADARALTHQGKT